ncbi:MAG: hypothetical protein DRN04_09930 [Thermoprotei archaeon]|nr:MAG: hypothetical protein DRN04_09930 [Thermoprotei archaeon]
MLKDIIKPAKEVWPLILLAVDNASPIHGFARIQLMFFIYKYIDFNYGLGTFGPYSHELTKALVKLEMDGLIKCHVVRSPGGGLVKKYMLTDRGKRIAFRLIEGMKGKYVRLSKVLVRKADEVVNDLEKLKKTFKDKPLMVLYLKALSMFEKSWPYFLNVPDETMKSYLLDYTKDLLFELKKVMFRGLETRSYIWLLSDI